MAPEWIYLLKLNIAIALFYAFYKLLCQRDTFFLWRRLSLQGFLAFSALYPLLNLQQWVETQPALAELGDYYSAIVMEDVEVMAGAAPASALPDLLALLVGIYFIGVGVMTFRFLFQLSSICRMRWIGRPVDIHGQRVISLPFDTNPFSFFGWIFVHLPSLEEDSRKEILMHEQTHARQWHSVDVLLGEILNIVCWFNPFCWLLKMEIRLNLEYLADRQVTETTRDFKQYQYHLLGLANTPKQVGLYNHFNVSFLKRRILMMNKKRTRTTGRIKYALFAPLAFALLLVSNISCVSNEKKQEEATPAPIEQQQAVPETEAQPAEQPVEKEVFQVVEEMPEFPGGMGECMNFLSKNIKYPTQAIENGIQGRVIVQFVVKSDGSIAEPKVVRGVEPLLDKEALRVIQQMPKWKPGKQRGKAVNVKYTLPVMFRLQ